MSEAPEGGTLSLWRRVTPYAAVVVVVFAAYPFVAFLNNNRAEITSVGQVVTYAAFTVFAALAVLMVVLLVRPRLAADRVAVGIAAFLACFFGFHLLFAADPRADRRLPQLIVWLVLTALLVVLMSRLARLAPVRTFVLVLGVALLALPLGGYVTWQITKKPGGAGSRVTTAAMAPEGVDEKPNVYLFVLDEYGRNDSLLEVLDFDNSGFYDELRDRNFVVEEDVHASFQQTIMSMASVFEMDYIATTEAEAVGGSVAVTDRLRGANATVEYFRSLGYDYVYSEPGLYDWNGCDESLVDLCIDPDGKGLYLSELELSILDLTPVGSLDLVREAITDPDYAIAQLHERLDEVDEPFFLYSHVVSPHWPFRYTPDCEVRSTFGYTRYLLNKSAEDAENYLQDLGCMNQLVLDGVDRVLEKDPDAIIIVMSDHGSKFIPDGAKRLEDWRPEAIREELGVLYAMHVPDRCRESVEETTNSVNTFRLVAACIEDRPPDLVEDRVFIWPHTGPGPQEVDDLSVLDPPS